MYSQLGIRHQYNNPPTHSCNSIPVPIDFTASTKVSEILTTINDRLIGTIAITAWTRIKQAHEWSVVSSTLKDHLVRWAFLFPHANGQSSQAAFVYG